MSHAVVDDPIIKRAAPPADPVQRSQLHQLQQPQQQQQPHHQQQPNIPGGQHVHHQFADNDHPPYHHTPYQPAPSPTVYHHPPPPSLPPHLQSQSSHHHHNNFAPPAAAAAAYHNHHQPFSGPIGPRIAAALSGGPPAYQPRQIAWPPSNPEPLSQRQEGGIVSPGAATAADVGAGVGVQPYLSDMRYIQGPLEVLNAEQYIGSPYSRRPPSQGLIKGAGAFGEPLPPPAAAASKKRGRKSVQSDRPEAEEEVKRTRGRPRLELTEDQDLKERRKTQIRFAQRAYRNRKENALKILETQVADLRSINIDIKDGFQALVVDYINGRGTGTQDPELQRRLEDFQNLLVKKSNEIESPNPSDEVSPERKSEDAHHRHLDHGHSSTATTIDNESEPTNNTDIKEKIEDKPQPMFGGIIVTHESEPQAMITEDTSSALPDPIEDDLGGMYTVVSYPNLDNASFSLPMMPNHLPPHLHHHHHPHHHMNPFLGSTSSSNLYHPHHLSPHQLDFSSVTNNGLPLPTSCAYMEHSFARRLQRYAVEKAMALMCMNNPPPALFQRVFGFVLNYDTCEGVRARLTNTLTKGAGDDLNSYGQPFHRVGGAGTHFLQPRGVAGDGGDDKANVLNNNAVNTGNYVTTEIGAAAGAPFPNAGFGMGPFNERTMHVRDNLLDELQNAHLPSWEGQWFDSHDIDMFLRENGIVMPLDEGYVEILPGPFYRKPDSVSASNNTSKVKPDENNDPNASGGGFAMDTTQSSHLTATAMGGGGGPVVPAGVPAGAAGAAAVTSHYPSPVSSVNSNGMPVSSVPVQPSNMAWNVSVGAANTTDYHNSLLSAAAAAAGYPPNNSTTTTGLFSGADSGVLGFSLQQQQQQQQQPQQPNPSASGSVQQRKRVLVNTVMFLEALTSKGTCLGRGPAFRRLDAVAAFWEAVKSEA